MYKQKNYSYGDKQMLQLTNLESNSTNLDASQELSIEDTKSISGGFGGAVGRRVGRAVGREAARRLGYGRAVQALAAAVGATIGGRSVS